MEIVEKYETPYLSYIYPIIQRMPRADGILRDEFLAAAIRQPGLFIEAGKVKKAVKPLALLPKLYAADAGLATLRFQLRFIVRLNIGVTPHNLDVAHGHLKEVGGMLNEWIASTKEAAKG